MIAKTHNAFFYGTLMAPAVLHRVTHGTTSPTSVQRAQFKITPALLTNHRRHRVRSADYPAILPDDHSGASVRGTFVTGLTDENIMRLDLFEGSEYERRKVTVRLLKQDGESEEGVLNGEGKTKMEEVEAETYVWIAGEHELEHEEWDFDEFVREKLWRWAGDEGNSEYADVDTVNESTGPDPTRGRGPNGSITKVLDASGNEKGKNDVLGSAV
ncbi:hypothetical protein K490DRAFT_48664 [Saccharata proteae CBS 121410]|uniref:Putative gamma-glutamylcyclotransferase n=1 Tax=Saccharata proteae CBS 121410 TaxID=1314787 RepID=A0A9P4LUW9_9PEZI|nr:hypothetical protein K490DRAFT_48664 [Saccharata proteae CBS 121410]